MTAPDSPAGAGPVAAAPAVLAELRHLEAAATAGPWRTADNPARRAYDDTTSVVQGDPAAKPRPPDRYIGHYVPSADAALIAAMRNALPMLLALADPAETEATSDKQISFADPAATEAAAARARREALDEVHERLAPLIRKPVGSIDGIAEARRIVRAVRDKGQQR